MVELIPPGEVRPLIREARALSDSLIIALLTISSVVTVTLFVVKGALDQLPEVVSSWRRAVQAMRGGTPHSQGEDETSNHDG
ncbi:hypothetical protein [Streptomyces curacoi]|uniref:Uncharacterized protein n=1 Tax=Streptomyces curacoi TaxID=146536 RepID=A0A117PI85_9ACTN|nr:hypothetical protein [Streptomyces curacoi]KUM80112.1 hypothetical protein AQI70_08070 [Streptomyces curacoi]